MFSLSSPSSDNERESTRFMTDDDSWRKLGKRELINSRRKVSSQLISSYFLAAS